MSISEKDTGGVFGSSLPEVSLEAGLNEKEKARLFELFEELAKAALGDHFRTHADFPQFISTYRQWIKSNHQDWLAAERQGQLNANVQDTVPFALPRELEPMDRQAVEKKLNQHRSWWVKQLKGEADQPSVLTSSDSLLEQKFSSEATVSSVEAESTEPIVAIERFVMAKAEELEYWDGEVFIREYIHLIWPVIFPNEKFALEPPDTRLDFFSKEEREQQLELWKKVIAEDQAKAVQRFDSLRERAGRAVIRKEVELVGETVAVEREERSLEWWIWYHINRDDAEINKMLEPYEGEVSKKNVQLLNEQSNEFFENAADYKIGEYGLIKYETYHGEVLALSDGVTIREGDKVGRLHIRRNIEKTLSLGEIEASRLLLQDFLQGMEQLANAIVAGEVKADFTALLCTTHLSSMKISRRLGFDEFEVTDVEERARAADVGASFVMARDPNANEEEVFARKFERVRKYAISRQKFLEKFGKKTQSPEEAAA